MEDILTPEMQALVEALGALVKADPRNEAIRQAIEEYERSEDLNALVSEYNAQHALLADAVGNGADADVREAVQQRIDALYEEITAHPVYAEYIRAKEAFDGLTNGIVNELQYVITGRRACSHDCASCGGCR